MSGYETLFSRSLRRLRRAWSELGSTLRGERHEIDPALGAEDAERLGQAIRDCLGSPGGDYARRTQAARIGQSYLSLNRTGRERFWRLLARDFDTDPAAIRRAIDEYLQATPGSDEARRRHRLREALVAPRAQLLSLLNTLPEGIKFLVDMRGELLGAGAAADPELHALEQDLKQLLASWFDVGFLQLRRVDWNTPAAFLEKLIEHEAVHAITSWADLKNRLASDRRLYAFVHPNMAEEPLIFLQVALCDALATNVQALLDTDAGTLDSGRADTAIFYSISNAQRGLASISFGNYLIRRVVADLKRELPGLRQFATLSPVPGFAGWLRERPELLAAPAPGAAERQALERLAAERAVEGVAGLLALPGWHRDEAVAQALRAALLGLCARYLCEKLPGKARALDAVAHFHLGNGATLQQLDWLADTSDKGLAQSCGIMVNYLYDPRTIDGNSESYALQGSIATSAAIRELLR